MSASNHTRSRRRSVIAIAAAAVAARSGASLQAIREWHEARTAAAHLMALSDDQLKDIGVHRGQIEFVVRGRPVPRTRRRDAEH